MSNDLKSKLRDGAEQAGEKLATRALERLVEWFMSPERVAVRRARRAARRARK
jgi:hypothetical protein